MLESTTYPGTTEEIIGHQLDQLGLQAGKDYCLCFSPERVDPGNKHYNIKNTPEVIGGITLQCLELTKELYGSIVDQLFLIVAMVGAGLYIVLLSVVPYTFGEHFTRRVHFIGNSMIGKTE